MSNGAQVETTTPQPLFFLSTHALLLADCGHNCNKVADPISPSNGNVSHEETDVTEPGAVAIGAFKRFYNSADSYSTDLGTGWRHSFSRQIVANVSSIAYQTYSNSDPQDSPSYPDPADACNVGWAYISATSTQWAGTTSSYANGVCSLSQGGSVVTTIPVYNGVQLPYVINGSATVGFTAIRDDGQRINFTLNGSTIVPPTGITLRLTQTGSGYQLIDDDDTVEVYNSAGALVSITTRAGVAETLAYDSSNRLSTITDSFGHVLTLGYDALSRLASVTDPNSNSVQYGYNSLSSLWTVTNLDGTGRSYAYENTSFPTLLTGVIDESATRYSTWGYDSVGRGNSSQEAGGADATGLVYASNGSVTSTDALGAVRTFTFNIIGNQNRVTSIGGSQCPTCQESAATTYDSAGFVSSRTDYNGNLTCYQNDPVRGLELYRVEGFAPGSTCPANLATYTPATGTLQRKISTVWSTTWREPSLITEPNRTTAYTFWANGSIKTKKITDLTVTPNVSRTWSYTINSYGQVLTVTGPTRSGYTDVTTYQYYTCSTGGQCGEVQTIQNQVGQTTTFNTYNAYGLPLTITDPNGVLTTLTYDARERLTSSQVGTGGTPETTYYTYWPIGLLKLVTRPDSSTILYTYDGAHRLTTITDSLGNYIQYTLDALGNHKVESSYDPSGTLHRTHTRVFNTLSELYQDINVFDSATTTYGYDSNGNQTSIAAPLGRNTGNQFDALNRLSQITDPNGGITKPGYDANDNLASVIDPRTLTTSYSHNGFGDLTQIVSPDTGTTVYAYDTAGNLKTVNDARGNTATYTFDDAKRLTKIAYGDQTFTYVYDAGTYGIGRLTSATGPNHSMSWAYDFDGRVTGKGQINGTVTQSVGYGYVNGDLITLVTPSGQTITYGYTNHRVTSVTVTPAGGSPTTVLSGVTYDPFGPATGWTWGNSTTVSRAYNEDGNPSQIVTAGVTNGYSVDDASRITSISDSGLSSNTWNFTAYDLLDRIQTASSSALSRGYTYDANGNVTSIGGTTASTETNSTTNNELGSTTGGLVRTYGYDAAGNTTSYTGATFTFYNNGRTDTAAVSGGTTTYVYNALKQLIKKSGNGGTTLLVYDEAGHLLGEYTSAGVLIQETVWMGDIPVATLRPSGSTIAIYYVHTDHLGTPRKVTRPSDNGLMWRWDPDTYGSMPANSNPAGLGTFTYNLRFPGQYYLAETGLHYNYFRTYDPQVGRYVESDPIGLSGGSFSTYNYGKANPISNKDPLGLVVTVQGQNPADQQALQNALNALKATPLGYQLWQQLDLSPMIYVIGDWVPGAAYPHGRYINVDPNYHPVVNTSCGPQAASTPIILGHEFGHVVRGDTVEDPASELADILQYENPLRQQMNLPMRLP
jgi:RHS repeat-associated protein